MRALIPAVALLTLAAACGSGAEQTAQSGPATLRMSIWTANEDHLKLFNEIAAGYTKAKVTFESIPIDSYTTTLTTQIAGGKAPDLAWILEGSAPDFVESGALAPLSSKIQNAAELAPAATRLWQKDGELYAYPFSTSPFGVFVNTDLLREAGKKVPAKGWTWQEAMDAAAAVAKKGKAGLIVGDWDYKNWTNLATLWEGWGAKAWSEDGATCGFNQPPMVEAMTFLHKSIFTDKALPGPGETVDFYSGDAAMIVTQISRASLLKDATFDWTLLPLPHGPAGEYSVIGQAGIGVIKKSPNAELAADFLGYFTNAENSAKLAQYFPPARTSQLNVETLAKSNPLLKPEQLQAVVIDGIPNGVVKPSHKGQEELIQTARAALDPLWQPGADVKAVLDGVCTKIQPLLGS
ncbi:ABC transporter substrate-binding protein [Nonomuraea fastidiosa]|jgi:multiple sugar transport system substrate-binding protein|uniref:ABC transporter substrate-binding protein n=1 Tax=Nonomuraea TaxID=83681 RepID=UPI00324EFF94